MAKTMKISVVIPAYNAEATIRATLDSVLQQTVAPDEILVFNDGSSDGTASILESYKPRVTVFQDSNHGAAYARNFLCKHAQGDILAFLDADDLWHPRFLEAQMKLIGKCPDAVAWFTGHETIVGLGDINWSEDTHSGLREPEVIHPVGFLKRYNRTPMHFGMSWICARKKLLQELGNEPFRVGGVEDTYFNNALPLVGAPIIRSSVRLAAYRIIGSSQSANLQQTSSQILDAFKILDRIYRAQASPVMYAAFRTVYASRTRNCGKYLMGSAKVRDARRRFLAAVCLSGSPTSVLKSIGLYGCTLLPSSLQPRWPTGARLFKNQPVRGETESIPSVG